MYCTLCVVLNRVSPCPLQRELEHQQRQQRLAELTSKAVRHYEHVLLRSRGLKPMENVCGAGERAVQQGWGIPRTLSAARSLLALEKCNCFESSGEGDKG